VKKDKIMKKVPCMLKDRLVKPPCQINDVTWCL